MQPPSARPTRLILTVLLALTLIGSLLVVCQSLIALEKPRAVVTKHTLTVTALRAGERVPELNNISSASLVSSVPAKSARPTEETSQHPPPPVRRFRADYECVGWRATSECSPDGELDPAGNVGCDISIPGGYSGFCLYRHKHSNETKRVLQMHCDSLSTNVVFDCEYAAQLVDYSAKSLGYTHDEAFAFDAIQRRAETENNGTELLAALSFERGISFVVYDDILPSTYASIRLLRELGTTLPIEVWYKRVEVTSDHPLLVDLVMNYSVLLREILDPFATDYYTKLYAVFYSAFDKVLLLDADNFAAKDPTYLFETSEFTATGALFWPDFWHPDSTIFHVNAHSVLWQVVGLPFVDMFEQESGQLLIDRTRHLRALNVLMYYGFSLPRVHEELVWGDKDLFRLAWLKSNSSFHMIATPPASAGTLQLATNTFCGLTMVQHDPSGEIVFLHRNLAKLRVDTLNQRVWTHVLQFKPNTPRSQYVIQWSKLFADVASCWGRTEPAEKLADFTLTPFNSFAFRDAEMRLLELVDEAAVVIYNGKKTPTTQ